MLLGLAVFLGLMGFLSDYMATSRACCASVQALATADVIGKASLDVPMSDHRAIQAAFPLTRASEGLEDGSRSGYQRLESII